MKKKRMGEVWGGTPNNYPKISLSDVAIAGGSPWVLLKKKSQQKLPPAVKRSSKPARFLTKTNSNQTRKLLWSNWKLKKKRTTPITTTTTVNLHFLLHTPDLSAEPSRATLLSFTFEILPYHTNGLQRQEQTFAKQSQCTLIPEVAKHCLQRRHDWV